MPSASILWLEGLLLRPGRIKSKQCSRGALSQVPQGPWITVRSTLGAQAGTYSMYVHCRDLGGEEHRRGPSVVSAGLPLCGRPTVQDRNTHRRGTAVSHAEAQRALDIEDCHWCGR
ncbi:hypothetical protein NDU88_001302 [Pleurodeles waltl]|uniref:Uncharacterized protein n=1 Tax=Pleurodeles waltl TaxID=8319 RepID=A0AAV7U808_PLEWA|nr:hypothetical protein NDU88_001302 [Pleurodeles waltl]